MGIYKYDPTQYIATNADIEKMLNLCQTPTEKLTVCLLWQTGARPMELLALKREDFTIKPDILKIALNTLKLQRARPSFPRRRVNAFLRTEPNLPPNPFIETIISLVEPMPIEQVIIPKSKRWMERLVHKLGMEVLHKDTVPYSFRHWRLSILADNGWPMTRLKAWKGAAGLSSISMYIGSKDTIADSASLKSD